MYDRDLEHLCPKVFNRGFLDPVDLEASELLIPDLDVVLEYFEHLQALDS
jgi:hypothetical protein